MAGVEDRGGNCSRQDAVRAAEGYWAVLWGRQGAFGVTSRGGACLTSILESSHSCCVGEPRQQGPGQKCRDWFR